tara:strand:- start:261 stop:440 length:180 start_codon:yes stop_codon:yes gene_type:complete
VELFEEIQFGFSGHSANRPIESGLVPAQLTNKAKNNNNQTVLIEREPRIGVNFNSSMAN